MDDPTFHRWSGRVEKAQQHDHGCFLCEHRCGADRLSGERGPCKAGPVPRVFRDRVEYSEELELVPSHLFYLSGCDLRCVFCIAESNAFDPSRGEPLTSEYFNAAVARSRHLRPRTLQWVGGEPTIHLPGILEVMARCPDLPPVVWKSDFYASREAMALLDGVVDVYVADFKFGNNDCARRLCGVRNYLEVIGRNLLIAAAHGDLIVRHLLLPGHFDCCYRPIVDWLKRNMPDVKFSVRGGYLPRWRARRDPELRQVLAPGHAEQASAWALHAGLNLVH